MLAVIAAVSIGSCKKKNIRWIIGGHRYQVVSLYVKQSSGQWKEVRDIGLGFIDEMTFVRNDLMTDGDVTVTNTSYEVTDYAAYGGVYDQDGNCYYYSDNGMYVAYQNVKEMVFHYKWEYRTDQVMNIKFSTVDPLISGVPGSVSLWTALSGDYLVEEDSRQKNQAYAGIIVLSKDNARMIIKY